MMDFSKQIKNLISDVEEALDHIRAQEKHLGIRLTKSVLTIGYQLTLSEKTEVKGRFLGCIPVGAGASHSSKDLHKLTLNLTRKQNTGVLSHDRQKAVADAILQMANGIKEIKAAESFSYTVDSFCLDFKIEVLDSGELQLMHGGSKENTETQELMLTFEFL